MLQDAEIFIAVVEKQSFAKAARQLQLSPPVITRHISKLEDMLQVRLLQRNTRQVSLTEAGSIFYDSCVSMIKIYALSLKQLRNLSDELIGTIKVGMPASISKIFIESIDVFYSKYPNIKLEIVNGNHLINLLGEGFDLVVHCGELADSSLYCQKLGSWEKITCASPGYLSLAGIPEKPQDLIKFKCLDHFDNKLSEWKYVINNNMESIRIDPEILSTSSFDLKHLALNGAGLAYLPSFTVGEEIRQGSLVEILGNYKVPKLNMYAVYPAVRYLSLRVKVIIDFLLNLNITSI